MGYDLARTSTVFSNKDQQDWLASDHGVTSADSITLDSAALLTAFPSGEIPSGVEVSRNPATGLYRPRLAANTTDTLPGFLLHGLQARAGVNPVGALHWHGEVVAARVPLGAGMAAPAAATHPMIRLV